MTPAQLRTAIEAALGAVPFTPPLGLAFCVAVRDALRALAPVAQLDVYHRRNELVVEAREGDVRHRLALTVG